MDEKDIEGMLDRLGKAIIIDQENKKALRKTFEESKKTRRVFYKRGIAVACLALLVFTAAYALWLAPISKVQADSLRVQNYMTYLEVEGNSNLSVAEYKGILYIPNVQEGIYKYDGKLEEQIYKGKVSLVKISPDGSKLVFFEEGKVGVLDLVTLKSRILLQSDSKTAFESPAWFHEEAILFTKYVIQDSASSYYDLSNAEIIMMDIGTLKQNKVTEGSNCTYIEATNSLLYQRGENIILMNLHDNTEKVIDQGEQPIASGDGKAIVYTKVHIAHESISKNVMIEKGLQNLWVADGVGYNRKNMITNNIILEDINQEEWLKSLKPSEELQILSLSGRYCYLHPTWSSDFKAIYAFRRDYSNNHGVIVKIELGKEELSAKAVTERYLQSIILKDEDYQGSLVAADIKDTNEIVENNLISFKVMKEGKEGRDDFVDVELNYEALGKNMHQASLIRFYLSKETGQYYIINMKKL